jgi:spore coat polysaccharide biosynthesis protein SpsF
MPYLYEVPGRFKVVQLNYPEDLGGLRWTLDTPKDLDFLREVYSGLGNRNDFSWLEVLQLVRVHPELAEINASVTHKTMFDTDTRSR